MITSEVKKCMYNAIEHFAAKGSQTFLFSKLKNYGLTYTRGRLIGEYIQLVINQEYG